MDWTFIGPHSIDENKGTVALKGDTEHDVVFWLNGNHINGQWFCGYYTFESFQQMAENGTGPLAEEKARLESLKTS